MVKVAIDAGHGGFGVTPGKRSPAGEYEWDFNNKVVKAAIKRLKEYGISVLRLDDPTGRTDVPLRTRTNKANSWGADVLVSCHHNANTGRWGDWTGTETFTYVGKWKDAERLAGLVQKRLVKAYGLRDRGLKKADFHVLRESNMTAILIEGGYMDSRIDIKKLRDDKVLAAAGRAVADGIAEFFGIEVKEEVEQSGNKKGELTVSQYKELKALIEKQDKQIKAQEKEIAALKKEKQTIPNVNATVDPAHADNWEWAKKKGLLNGTNPLGHVSREQLASVMRNFYDRFIANPAKAEEYAAEALKWAQENGISDASNPAHLASRQQVITIVHRTVELVLSAVESTLDDMQKMIEKASKEKEAEEFNKMRSRGIQ